MTDARGFLSDADIEARQGELFPGQTIPAGRIAGASVDLCLGAHYYLSSEAVPKVLTGEDPYLRIPRGDFALLMTDERVQLPPDMLALITMKLGVAKARGLINVSGFHVDPGFEGALTYAVYNAGPSDITVKYRDPLFQIFFSQLSSTAKKPYDGDMKGRTELPTEMVAKIASGDPVNPVNLDKRLRQLELKATMLTAGLAILAAPLVAYIIGVLSRR